MAIKYISDSFLFSRDLIKPGGGIPNYYRYNYGTTLVRSYDKLIRVNPSRVKPADLAANPTSQPLVWDYKCTHGVYKKPEAYLKNESGVGDVYRESYTPYIYPVPKNIPSVNTGSTKHLLRIRSRVNDVSSLVAELHKSADGFVTIAEKARKIANRVKDARKGKFRSRKELKLSDISDTHLAVTYGIKPVVSDAYTVWEGTERVNRAFLHTIRTRHTERVSYTDSNSKPWQGTVVHTRTSLVRMNPNAGNYDIGNPLEWAWENIPFSFVLDWFVNVGDTIAASFVDRSCQHVSTVRSVKTELTNRKPNLPAPYVLVRNAACKYRSHKRDVLGAFEVPDRVRLEPTKSLSALSNAVALLVSVRARR